MKWLSSLLLIAGLQATVSAQVLNLDLTFSNSEIDAGSTASFNLNGQFRVNITGTDTETPDRFQFSTSMYDASGAQPYGTLYLDFESTSILGSITATNTYAGGSVSAVTPLAIIISYGQLPEFLSQPEPYLQIDFYLDISHYDLFNEAEYLSDILVDVSLSGQFTIIGAGNSAGIDLMDALQDEYASMGDDTAQIQASIIPEPSAYAGLAGLAALGGAWIRRRHRTI